MSRLRPLCAAGAVLLPLLAGCDRPAPTTPTGQPGRYTIVAPPLDRDARLSVAYPTRADHDTTNARRADATPGVGIRPTGATANGLTP